jgi:hypothetical protein
MKNIHIIPTDKPSRLWTNNLRRRLELDEFPEQHPTNIAKHIYITNDEEIKEGDYCISHLNIIDEGKIHNSQTIFNPKTKEDLIALQSCKKIILTTDQDLNGVQAIDDDFLEWFVKNPSCENVGIEPLMAGFVDDEPSYYENMYDIIIPKEEPKQALGKETADYIDRHIVEALVEVAKQKMYSVEEVEDLIYKICGTVARLQGITLNGNHIDTAYNQHKTK